MFPAQIDLRFPLQKGRKRRVINSFEADIVKKPNTKPKFLNLNKNFAISDSIKFKQPFMTKPVRLRFERMGEETEKEEKKRKASLATISAFNSKSKVTQSQIDKFKELNQKLLQIKETNNQKINIKGNSNTRKRPCVELEPKANKDASVTTKCTEPKRPQIFEPAQLEEPEHVPQKYKRKLHWGLDTKERWERKSNM